MRPICSFQCFPDSKQYNEVPHTPRSFTQASCFLCHPCVQIKDCGCKAGVVLNPATSLSTIEYVLDVVDLVLIMSVNPGFGGQKFIESQVGKIKALKQMCNERGVNPWIEVDGGVTPENAYKVCAFACEHVLAACVRFGQHAPCRPIAACYNHALVQHVDVQCGSYCIT